MSDTIISNGSSLTPPVPKPKRIILRKLSRGQREALISGGYMSAGIVAGLGLSSLFSVASASEAEAAEAPQDTDATTAEVEPVVVYTEAPMANSVSDEMAFNEAFSAARQEIGAGGFFEWRGTTYNTYYSEELDAMSTDELVAYQDSLQNHLTNQPVEPYVEAEPVDSLDVPVADVTTPDPAEPVPTINEPTEEMIGIDMDGDGDNDALALNNDLDDFIEVIAIDTDGNNTPDVFMIDSDDNNSIDLLITDPAEDGIQGDEEIEVLEEPEFITLDDLRPEAPVESTPAPTPAPNDEYQADLDITEEGELPDFDNDADVSQFT